MIYSGQLPCSQQRAPGKSSKGLSKLRELKLVGVVLVAPYGCLLLDVSAAL
jgi:hypothetical protein